MPHDQPDFVSDRRVFLRRAACTAVGASVVKIIAPAVAAFGTASCTRTEEEDGALRVPLSSLEEGERKVLLHGERPVELLRRGDEVTARSLFCTHEGCVVQWKSSESLYRCPCHDGRFAPDGSVLGGPPTEPLRTLTVHVEGEIVVVQH